MAHREGHFDSTTFKRLEDKFKEDKSSGKYDLNYKSDSSDKFNNLPTFSFRGKDKFAKNLSEGTLVKNAFTKIKRERDGSKPKYPYLTSRFLINPKIKDPFVRNERTNLNTIRDDERNLQQTRAKRGISGPSDLLKDYEASAKLSSQIGENLLNARELGSEEALSQAIFEAQEQSREDRMLSQISREPRPGEKFGDKFTGDYVDNVAFKNATMLDEYNNTFQNSVVAQDKSDYYREYFGGRVNRPLVNNYFDTRGGE